MANIFTKIVLGHIVVVSADGNEVVVEVTNLDCRLDESRKIRKLITELRYKIRIRTYATLDGDCKAKRVDHTMIMKDDMIEIARAGIIRISNHLNALFLARDGELFYVSNPREYFMPTAYYVRIEGGITKRYNWYNARDVIDAELKEDAEYSDVRFWMKFHKGFYQQDRKEEHLLRCELYSTKLDNMRRERFNREFTLITEKPEFVKVAC